MMFFIVDSTIRFIFFALVIDVKYFSREEPEFNI
jgi:hypothetical protein